ncbi:MAG: hypothetical protein PHE25_00630 [Candidatus Gracilibacteria bacterium]|nr:hypothetical protein [Candidatus Gracilibacteria bacterium]
MLKEFVAPVCNSISSYGIDKLKKAAKIFAIASGLILGGETLYHSTDIKQDPEYAELWKRFTSGDRKGMDVDASSTGPGPIDYQDWDGQMALGAKLTGGVLGERNELLSKKCDISHGEWINHGRWSPYAGYEDKSYCINFQNTLNGIRADLRKILTIN